MSTRSTQVDGYVEAIVEVVAEARALARRRGHVIDELPDEEVLRGLLRLREAVARSAHVPAQRCR